VRGQDAEVKGGCDQIPKESAQREAPVKEGLYASPNDALKTVADSYNYSSGKLTDLSLQMCYALIGANWAIFGSKNGVNGILGSFWAKWSMLLVLLALVSNVVAAFVLSQLLENRVDYAESDNPRWVTEFDKSSGKHVAWPFTNAINNTGKAMRWMRTALTIAAGVCLIIGAIVQ
jgi:hypothetical protein